MTSLDSQIIEIINKIKNFSQQGKLELVYSYADDISIKIYNYNMNNQQPENFSKKFNQLLYNLTSDSYNALHEGLGTIYKCSLKNDINNLEKEFKDNIKAEVID